MSGRAFGITAAVAALTVALAWPAARAATPASEAGGTGAFLFTGGRILAGVETDSTGAHPRFVDAMLVSDGSIVATGAIERVEAAAVRRQLKPKRVSLAGKFVTAGLCDAHGHVSGLGFALERLRFEGTTSAEQVAAMVAAEAKKRPRGEWIQGRGWDQNDWAVKEFPTRDLLDRAAPDHPVWLRRVDGHAAWGNSKALAAAGITAATPDPGGGRIVRAADGTPTGVLVDNATSLVTRAVPAPTRAQTRAAIVRALEHCRSLGLTAVHDAGIDTLQLGVYRELVEAHAMPIRVFAMLSAETAMLPGLLPREKLESKDGMFRVFAVKAYADGALGSRGAALLAPYADDPANRGLAVTTPDTLEWVARAAADSGYQMCVHAIGDSANRLTLRVYERAAGGGGTLRQKRFRIEHAQVMSLADIDRLARDGVIASMQPTHCTSDMPWAPARLGPERIEGAYAWRRLLKAGARLALGSDFPVESADPRLGLYAAVTTSATDGQPPEGFRPGEKLTMAEALRGFTSDGAYAAFAERELGQLRPGLRADFVVWDRDLLAVPAAEVLKAKALEVWIGGVKR